MVNTAHFITAQATPSVIIRDDRGTPVTQLDLQESVARPEQAEPAMRDAGWARSADWTESDDGWVAPVVPA